MPDAPVADTDVVDELRRGEWCHYWTAGPNSTGFAIDPSPVPAQAAAEIARLRAQLAEARKPDLQVLLAFEAGQTIGQDHMDAEPDAPTQRPEPVSQRSPPPSGSASL